MLIDTHCHLADPAFSADVGEVVSRAVAAGVHHTVVIGESAAAAERAFELAAGDARLSVSTGVHPHDASGWCADEEARLRRAAARPELVAIGEIGLDYHYDHSPRPRQQEVFDLQMAIAAELERPVVIHAREADDDIAAILRNYPRVTAVLHSFSSGVDLLRTGVALGHYVSLSGMLTFKSWRLDDAVREVPLERLLVETDAPYLAPVPCRGKRNEPGYVVAVAKRLADVVGTSFERISEITTENAVRVFGARLRM
ncbi:MAG: TatD family hydrolase [Gemmatimonadota bacterium]